MLGVVVSSDLCIQERQDHMGPTALSQSLIRAIAANSIVAIDDALAVIVEASDEVEGVIGEEPPSIEGLCDQISH